MPPKKKQRLPSRGPSTPSTDNAPPVRTPVQPTSSKPPVDEATLLADPWTDEQETALFKGVIRFKPVGMHKHFRMIALHNYLHSTGCTSPSDAHTRIPGIWDKLSQLYNLPILDEREDAFLPSPPDDPTGSALYHPFRLPEEEYGPLMFERRLALSPSTPAVSDRGVESRLTSTIEDTDELRSSPVPKKTGRAGGRGTKKAKPKEELEASIGEGEAGEEMEDAGEGEGEDEDEDEEETENAEEEDGEEETKAASSKAKKGKGRGGRGSRRKAKAR